MRAQKTQIGYTIVETLIVLVVTSTMFVITVLLISGQIAKYQFRDSSYNSQQAIQDKLNDTQVGYFSTVPNASTYCTDGNIASEGNARCVYAGKKIEVTTTGNVITTPLLVSDTAGFPSGIANVTQMTASAITEKLPTGVDYTKGSTVYVLFTNYPNVSTDSFIGGAQTTKVYTDSAGTFTVSNTGQTVCIANGSRKARLTLGKDGNPNVLIEYQPATGDCI